MYNGNNEITYNDFSGIEEIPYRVLTWLISNKTKVAEDMWKALYYSDYDALKKKNLRALTWICKLNYHRQLSREKSPST